KLETIRAALAEAPGPCAVYLHVDHRALGGVKMRCRSTRVALGARLLGRLEEILEPARIRVSGAEIGQIRSAELFGAGLRAGAAPPVPAAQGA
ncbi:MAG: hypothetical protein KC729_04390, partial [Candidatus Eisenbacteria bacterium]|nr:hypothetical protein [Candidatus Eisenbacteria bacterium]